MQNDKIYLIFDKFLLTNDKFRVITVTEYTNGGIIMYNDKTTVALKVIIKFCYVGLALALFFCIYYSTSEHTAQPGFTEWK